jgi:hypothetical protein
MQYISQQVERQDTSTQTERDQQRSDREQMWQDWVYKKRGN